MDVTVLSVPNSGTRFLLYMIWKVMGLQTDYAHFLPRFIPQLDSLSGPVVMPVRENRPIPPEYRKYVPVDVLTIQIAKSPRRWDEVDSLVQRTGAEWTISLEQYVDLWEPVGSRAASSDSHSIEVIQRFHHD